MRFRNIEFRWSKANKKYEIVKWYDECPTEWCYTLAFLEKGKEGYDMRTVGSRFFDDKNAWVVAKWAMAFLTETFNIEEDEQGE
jgi:hypothetical protein